MVCDATLSAENIQQEVSIEMHMNFFLIFNDYMVGGWGSLSLDLK